jgi:hypothetical protein
LKLEYVQSLDPADNPRKLHYMIHLMLYGSETWSLTLRVFEDKLQGRIFGPKREEGTGNRKKLHDEELRNLDLHQILLE